ncbi:transposase [Rhizobium leguminosarum]|uniref:Transposase n=1 Tax=Rhizobium leguminosarum TaxID=384 RepID=A0A7M3E352_RHILE|nr:transposase [Rhizobium leguminosarum bv. viciae]TAU23285.1 transposase [Rhizobium leguminosarum]TAU43281.1 transposase [Rhizobium leguminosarum]TAU98902.1 transposase [Rhizobium leguminosarum]TAV13692.1 transposase [Rhizobium leguminosarum]
MRLGANVSGFVSSFTPARSICIYHGEQFAVIRTVRTVLTDARWERTAPIVRARSPIPAAGRPQPAFLEAVLWKACTNSPRRDLPKEFGNWNTVFKRVDD